MQTMPINPAFPDQRAVTLHATERYAILTAAKERRMLNSRPSGGQGILEVPRRLRAVFARSLRPDHAA